MRLVSELAKYEKLEPPSPAARARLKKDAFGSRPKFDLWLAHPRRRPPVAYAVVLWTYSSFLAKPTLYLEDIYVQPAHRGTGLARRFVERLAREALTRGAGRLEGIVLGWNRRARRFYARLGADEKRDWIFFRLSETALRRLVHER